MSNTELERIGRVFEAVLKPICKILISNNFNLKSSVEYLKRLLVQAAMDDETSTDSVISLRTGVHRKDVKRIRAELTGDMPARTSIGGLPVVLSMWCQSEPFADGKGMGRVLSRKGTASNPGFDELVKASKVDLAPATVLAELLAQELVIERADGTIELLSSAFVTSSGEAAIDAFEATIADHVRIAAENVLLPSSEQRKFDRVLRYSHLSSRSVEILEAEARGMAEDYLKRLNAMAHRLQSEDEMSKGPTDGRFVTGVFIAPTAPSDRPESDDPNRSGETKEK